MDQPDESGDASLGLLALGSIQREMGVPPDIDDALAETAPQALLRDLHRPVSGFEVPMMEFGQLPFIRADAGGAETAQRRQTLLASYKVPIETLVPTAALVREDRAALRATLALPWSDAPKLGQMTEEETEEAERWFR